MGFHLLFFKWLLALNWMMIILNLYIGNGWKSPFPSPSIHLKPLVVQGSYGIFGSDASVGVLYILEHNRKPSRSYSQYHFGVIFEYIFKI